MILLESFLVTLSFFSTIPVKILDWTSERIRFIPIMMGFVGLVIFIPIYLVFNYLNFDLVISSLIYILIYTVLTGGLHNDALMDSADAHFSRRPLEKKLEIMTDSRVGAFAVMSYVNYIIMLFIVMYYFFKMDLNMFIVALVLFNSRALTGVMNYNLKYAKEDGLAKMYSETLKKSDKYILYVLVGLVNGGISYFIGFSHLIILLSGICFYHVYKRFMYKEFKGITGDLLGTYVLLSELVMYSSMIAWYLWN